MKVDWTGPTWTALRLPFNVSDDVLLQKPESVDHSLGPSLLPSPSPRDGPAERRGTL